MNNGTRNGASGSGQKVLIVGGVAGGASCAARARRLSEEAEIIIFERGPYSSFANCGLPYYIGDVITGENELIVATPQLLKGRFNIDVRVENEVLAIDREKKEIEVKNLATGETYRERYDALVLSPGAAPVRPPLPGIDLAGIFSLRSIPDSRQVRAWIEEHGARHALVVGGGFIGLEMTENLVNRGLSVTLVEKERQVMPALDPEMAAPLHRHLKAREVALRLGEAVTGFRQHDSGEISFSLESGDSGAADLVIFSVGVRPETALAEAAGLEIGARGIRVDDRMRTSDENIWAIGDAVEVRDVVTGDWTSLPLAGPANRQGRIAADVIFGRDNRFRGVQGSNACRLFDMTIAATGATEKTLARINTTDRVVSYQKVYLHPHQHAGFYPGAERMYFKLVFAVEDGRVLGAQAVGKEGVDKRIDVVAMAIQRGATVFDLAEAELCYAPQFGAAKDAVNIAGMVAANTLRGDAPVLHWGETPEPDVTVIDVRNHGEVKVERIEGALHIPLNELRRRMAELPAGGRIWVNCAIGQRSYFAVRALRLNGFDARYFSGGLRTYHTLAPFLAGNEWPRLVNG